MVKKALFVFSFIFINVLANAQFVNPLIIPDTLTGTTFNLTMDESTVQFLNGTATATYGINADYLAPTIIFNARGFGR
jgi:hypothetical protein